MSKDKDQDKLDQAVADAVAKAAPGGFTKEERDGIKKQSEERAGKLKDVNLSLAFARQAVSFVKQQVKLGAANWDERLATSSEAVLEVDLTPVRARHQADHAGVELQYKTELDRITKQYEKDGDKTKAGIAWEQANARAKLGFEQVAAKAKTAAEPALKKFEKNWDKVDQCVYGKLRASGDWQRINAKEKGVESLEDITTLADLANKHSCGNCGEMTAAAYKHLHNVGVRPLDFVSLLEPGDHAFVVIGRKAGTDSDTFGTTWGKDAVICDPWASGLIIPSPAGTKGPPRTFGDSYAVYTVDLLEQKMKAMHSTFKGVRFQHRDS